MLNNLKPLNTKKSKKTRVGRGVGSGHGGHTALRGNKGQKSRSGHKKLPWYFEGGQLPLVKRLPHLRGFKNFNRKNIVTVKTSDLENIKETKLTPKILVDLGLIKKTKNGVKVLFDTKVTKKLTMTGFMYSKTAKDSIEKAGGKAN